LNALTTIPAWERYRPALDALKPGCSDEEARYRCGLMVLRDNAQRRLDRDPTGMMRAVWLNASDVFLRSMDGDQLRDCWGALGRMFVASRQLGDVFRALGGDDACG